MRTYSSGIAIAVLASLMTGCSSLHLPHSQQAQAPPLQTGQGQLEQEDKKNHQEPPPSSLPQPSAQATPPQLPPVKLPKAKHPKKKKPAENASPSTPASSATTQQAAVTPSATAPAGTTPTAATPPAHDPAATPFGQLTTGDDATGAQTNHNAAALIRQTQDGLEKITRKLTADEQVTAAQIRTFLKQAKQALDIGDSDGAETLATKAKLLLDELTKT